MYPFLFILSRVVESETPTNNKNSRSCIYDPIKPHEQRALNYLINEYLLMHGYKLTSITFADENEDQVFIFILQCKLDMVLDNYNRWFI